MQNKACSHLAELGEWSASFKFLASRKLCHFFFPTLGRANYSKLSKICQSHIKCSFGFFSDSKSACSCSARTSQQFSRPTWVRNNGCLFLAQVTMSQELAVVPACHRCFLAKSSRDHVVVLPSGAASQDYHRLIPSLFKDQSAVSTRSLLKVWQLATAI